jgi:hypothetical protein
LASFEKVLKAARLKNSKAIKAKSKQKPKEPTSESSSDSETTDDGDVMIIERAQVARAKKIKTVSFTAETLASTRVPRKARTVVQKVTIPVNPTPIMLDTGLNKSETVATIPIGDVEASIGYMDLDSDTEQSCAGFFVAAVDAKNSDAIDSKVQKKVPNPGAKLSSDILEELEVDLQLANLGFSTTVNSDSEDADE